MQAKRTGRLPLWALGTTLLGVLLLLNNFLLSDPVDVGALWPLLLVLAGAIIIIRGDLLPTAAPKPFSITRGSVEAGVIEVNAGEIDVRLRALSREGRLIAGIFAPDSRPGLIVDEGNAYLRLDRSATPWLAFNEWEMNLARDLPWEVYVSTHLGQVELDLSEVIVQEVVIGTGFGDIRVVCPHEAFAPLYLQSALGDVHVLTPPGVNARISVQESPLFRLHIDQQRYEQVEPGLFATRTFHPDSPEISVYVRGTFGDAYLG